MPHKSPTFQSPEEFEAHVKEILDKQGFSLESYQSELREKVKALDGNYEIDITARFKAFGIKFLVVVECKNWTNPVKREQVLSLESKKQSVGAQKAMLYTTSSFQEGAIEFAEAHGIALLQIRVGNSSIQADSCRHAHWVHNLTSLIQISPGGYTLTHLTNAGERPLLNYFGRDGL